MNLDNRISWNNADKRFRFKICKAANLYILTRLLQSNWQDLTEYEKKKLVRIGVYN